MAWIRERILEVLFELVKWH